MKLSELKAYIAEIEAMSPNNDPDISFWIERKEGWPQAGEKDSHCFIDFEIDRSDDLKQHKIEGSCKDTIQTKGDFTIPLMVVPFYK